MSVKPKNLYGREIFDKERIQSELYASKAAGLWCSSNDYGMGIEPTEYGVTIMERFKKGFIPYTLLLMMGAILGLLLYWTFYPNDVFEVTRSEFVDAQYKIDDLPIYQPGDTVIIDFDYKKFYQRRAHLVRFLVKENEPHKGMTISILATTLHGNLPVGSGTGRISFIIPSTVPNGIYRAKTCITYFLNPVRPEFNETWYTDEFMVRNKVNE